MRKINIREALLDIDRRTNAQYDLTTLYEACKLSEDDKKKVVQYIDTKEPPFMIGEFLASKCDAVCESIVGDDEVSEAEMKKIVDDINDGGDHTLWTLMAKADEEDNKLTEAAEEPREGYDSRAAIRQVWRMIANSEKLTDDDSRYWDLDRGVHEGDNAVIISNVQEAPETAMYQFSLMDDGIDLDVMLDRMGENDTWYIINNSNTKYGDNDDSLNEDIISVDTADLENKIRAAATDVVVNKLGYDQGFADKYVVIEVGNTDEEDARVRVEVRADLSYEEAQEVADALNPIVKEYDKDAYFDAVTHNTIEAYIRLDQSDDVVDEEAFNYWKGLFDKVTTRGDLINHYKELVRKRDEGSITWGTMDKLFDEVIGPLNDRLDAENSPKVDEAFDGEVQKIATNGKGDYLIASDSGRGYTAFNKNDVCIGGIDTDDEEEAKSKFISGKLDEAAFNLASMDAVSEDTRKLSRNDLIYRYNFGGKLSDEDIARIGNVKEYNDNKTRVKELVDFIRECGAGNYSVSKKKDWDALSLVIRGDVVPEDIQQTIKDKAKEIFSDSPHIDVYGGDVYSRHNALVSISPMRTDISTMTEAAVGTMERPMTELKGTLSNVLTQHWNEWATITDTREALAFIDSIEPEVSNKSYIKKVKAKLLNGSVRGKGIERYFTGIIAKGDGHGRDKEGQSKKKYYSESLGGSSLYLFPELTAEDLEMAKAYGLTYLGKNHGTDGSENNCVVAGDMSSLQRYADKYLGYELHPDYLYDDADDFAGDIIKEEVELTNCPNCGGERFNDSTGLCVDCGYDEKGHGDLDESKSINEADTKSRFANNIDQDIISGLSSEIPEQPIQGGMVKCSKSAPLNALYYVSQGEDVKFNLGNIKLPMKQITHCWVEHTGEVAQTRNDRPDSDLVLKYSVDLIPNDIEGSKKLITDQINKINGLNESRALKESIGEKLRAEIFADARDNSDDSEPKYFWIGLSTAVFKDRLTQSELLSMLEDHMDESDPEYSDLLRGFEANGGQLLEESKSIKEDTFGYKSGNRYYGGLPSEGSDTDYAELIINAASEQEKFLAKYGVKKEHRSTSFDSGEDKYTGNINGHDFEYIEGSRFPNKHWVSRLVIDNKEVDIYKSKSDPGYWATIDDSFSISDLIDMLSNDRFDAIVFKKSPEELKKIPLYSFTRSKTYSGYFTPYDILGRLKKIRNREYYKYPNLEIKTRLLSGGSYPRIEEKYIGPKDELVAFMRAVGLNSNFDKDIELEQPTNESKSINEDIDSETIISQVQDFINSGESLVNIINYLFTCDCTPDEVIRLLVDRFDCQEVLVKDTLADDFGIEVGSRYVESESLRESDGYNPEYSNYIEEVAQRIDAGEYDDTYEVCEYVAKKFNKDIETVKNDVNRLISKQSGSIKEGYRGDDGLDDILGWLQDHEQAWDDFCVHFEDVEDEDLTQDMVVGWISEHDQLYDDFLSYFDDEEDEFLDESKSLKEYYEFIDRKSVEDSDGFMTDYSMYRDVVSGKYVFVFGDSDIYSPEDGDFDWECETEEEARQWFNSYNGFADDEEYSFELDEGIWDNVKKIGSKVGAAAKSAYDNVLKPVGQGVASTPQFKQAADKVKDAKKAVSSMQQKAADKNPQQAMEKAIRKNAKTPKEAQKIATDIYNDMVSRGVIKDSPKSKAMIRDAVKNAGSAIEINKRNKAKQDLKQSPVGSRILNTRTPEEARKQIEFALNNAKTKKAISSSVTPVFNLAVEAGYLSPADSQWYESALQKKLSTMSRKPKKEAQPTTGDVPVTESAENPYTKSLTEARSDMELLIREHIRLAVRFIHDLLSRSEKFSAFAAPFDTRRLFYSKVRRKDAVEGYILVFEDEFPEFDRNDVAKYVNSTPEWQSYVHQSPFDIDYYATEYQGIKIRVSKKDEHDYTDLLAPKTVDPSGERTYETSPDFNVIEGVPGEELEELLYSFLLQVNDSLRGGRSLSSSGAVGRAYNYFVEYADEEGWKYKASDIKKLLRYVVDTDFTW